MTRSSHRSDHPYRGSSPRGDGGDERRCFRRLGLRRLLPRHGAGASSDRTPEDAAQIVQRICGVCPASHSHASTIAAEKAYGIDHFQQRAHHPQPHRGRAVPAQPYPVVLQPGGSRLREPAERPEGRRRRRLCPGRRPRAPPANTDLGALKEQPAAVRRQRAAVHLLRQLVRRRRRHQPSSCRPRLDLICTAHYLEALKMQAKASRDCGPCWAARCPTSWSR